MSSLGIEELQEIEEHITHIMFEMCQECRFIAAMRIIESLDIELVEELRDYMEDERLSDQSGPTNHPDPQPNHRQGGCYVRCLEDNC